MIGMVPREDQSFQMLRMSENMRQSVSKCFFLSFTNKAIFVLVVVVIVVLTSSYLRCSCYYTTKLADVI